MDLRRQTNGQCRMNHIDARGDANLCCCYIIDENGKIDDIFHKVKVDGHLEEVLGELDIMP